jgi:very-short-patch-repair endonuclease
MHDDVAVLRVAEKQYGAFSRGQARHAGFSADAVQRRVRKGTWRPLHPGVYRATGAAPTWLQRCAAAALWAGEGAAVAGFSAARLWGFELPAKIEADPLVHLDLPNPWWRGALVGVRSFRRVKLGRDDLASHQGIRCTTPERTLLDIAGLLGAQGLEIALDSARRRYPQVTRALARLLIRLGTRGRKGAGILRALVADRLDLRQDSAVEVRLLRGLRCTGLRPRCNVRIRVQGKHVATVDFLFPKERVIIQTHGYAFHSDRRQWERDIAQTRALQQLGYRVIAFSAAEVRGDLAGCVRAVRLLLARPA